MIPESVGLDAFPWHVHPEVLGVAVALVVGYVYAIRRLGPRFTPTGEPTVTGSQIAWFVVAIGSYAMVELTPVHDIGAGSLYSVHMVEHLVLTLVFPPAMLFAIPTWLMRVIVRPFLPVLRILAKPVVAFVLFNVVVALTHVPSIVTAIVTTELVHLGFHLALVATAFFMWWPVIGPIPEIPRLRPFAAMGYLFLQSLVPTIPASFLTFADTAVYRIYAELPKLWGIDTVTDQMVGGLIMKVGGGVILWTAIAVIFFRWAADEERASRLHTGRVVAR